MTCVAHNIKTPCLRCTLARQRQDELARLERFWKNIKVGLLLASLWTAAIIAYC